MLIRVAKDNTKKMKVDVSEVGGKWKSIAGSLAAIQNSW